ncbi:hypothetical protein HanLR1_Chr09g0337521 [Helianthus annuus]|nr:hypothetical protein HanLR1_Chr09g0337521 [Helianthus annuus]
MPELAVDCRTTSYGAVSLSGFWSKHCGDVSYSQLHKVFHGRRVHSKHLKKPLKRLCNHKRNFFTKYISHKYNF